MAKLIDAGDGMFVDPEPVAAPDGMPDAHVYAYAQLHSLERVSYGLLLTTGGPEGEEIESMKVGAYGMEPLAPFWEFGDALKELERDGSFEEVPLVEVTSNEEYNEALDVLDKKADAGISDDNQWEKPGLYDFRDDPPTYAGTVEEYEQEEMANAADEAIDFMLQGDEWKEIYRELTAANEEK
jgi:hypothetical protein